MFLAVWVINCKVHFNCCSEALGSFEPCAQKKGDQNTNTMGVLQEVTVSTNITDYVGSLTSHVSIYLNHSGNNIQESFFHYLLLF